MKKSLYLLLAIFLTACLPQGVQVPQSPLLSVIERKSGLISYIGLDGNMYVVDQGGSNPTQLTKDSNITDNSAQTLVGYQNPTWSPDGSKLAFTRLQKTDQKLSSEILVANVDDDSVNSIYTSHADYPFYLYWSPDNANISFIASTPGSQTIAFKIIPSNGGDERILDVGTPFYWSWAPDGKNMIVHKGNEDGTTQLSFLRVDSDVTEFAVDEAPASFIAPAWSPDGRYILLTKRTEKEQQIILADSTGKELKTISTFDMNAAFAWSFDSSQFAYIIGTEKMQSGTLGTLHVYDVESGEDVTVGENVVGFFWSPNNKKLAYFLPYLVNPNSDGSNNNSSNSSPSDATVLVFQLNMFDIGSGESKELFTFQPTDQFASMITFFDQYHQSATIWSPDNNNLVLSFIGQDGTPGIAVVAPSGQMEPRIIAQGLFGIWSWQ